MESNRRIAIQIASQLPSDIEDARSVVALLEEMIVWMYRPEGDRTVEVVPLKAAVGQVKLAALTSTAPIVDDHPVLRFPSSNRRNRTGEGSIIPS